jgi:hypothetical protein
MCSDWERQKYIQFVLHSFMFALYRFAVLGRLHPSGYVLTGSGTRVGLPNPISFLCQYRMKR